MKTRLAVTAVVVLSFVGTPRMASAQTAPPGPQTLSPTASAAAQYPIRDAVNDYAGVLDADTRAQLADAAKQIEMQHKVHVNFVTVKTLNGAQVGAVSMAIANNWATRHTANQRNVQILLDIDERKMRFDVCRSLESVVTDADANGILQEMTPMLREADYGRALLNAAQTVGDMLASKEQNAPTAPAPNPNAPQFSRHASSGSNSAGAGYACSAFVTELKNAPRKFRLRAGAPYGMTPSEAKLFVMLDTRARQKYGCFLAELFIDETGFAYALCFRPVAIAADRSRYACRYLNISINDAAATLAAGAPPVSFADNFQRELESLSKEAAQVA